MIPCFILGTYLIFSKKGTNIHSLLGKIYMALMGLTGVLTLFIPAYVGPRLLNHFGLLHLLSILTLWSVPRAYFAIKRGDVRTHKWSMIRLYFGGIIIAGAFAIFVEGRYLHSVLFK
jgi:uncharacterized membrane protein